MTFLKRIQSIFTQETCLTNFKEEKIYRSGSSVGSILKDIAS